MYKNIKSNKLELLYKVKTVAEDFLEIVGSTLGPQGKIVGLYQTREAGSESPVVTKDGVTVAKFISYDDPVKSLIADIIKQSSLRTNENAGDGTTTTIVLACHLILEFIKEIYGDIKVKRGSYVSKKNKKFNLREAKKDLSRLLDEFSSFIDKRSRLLSSKEDIQNIATLSSNNDSSIGKIISLAYDKIGEAGGITVKEGINHKTTLDIKEGFLIDSGYISNKFVNDKRRNVAKFDDPMFFITDSILNSVESMLPVLSLAARENRPLVIVAEDVEGQMLASLIANSLQGNMKVVAIRAPRFGQEKRDILEDMAVFTGATYWNKLMRRSLKDFTLHDFGNAKSVEIGKKNTTIVGGKFKQTEYEEKLESLENLIQEEEDNSVARVYHERLTRLGSAVATIYAGGATEVEMVERKHRIEDALEAVRAAQNDGLIPGGSKMFSSFAFKLEPKKKFLQKDKRSLIEKVFEKSLVGHRNTLASNSNIALGELELSAIKNQSEMGVDMRTGKIVPLFSKGIIEPSRVAKEAMKNAASVFETIISMDNSVIKQEVKIERINSL